MSESHISAVRATPPLRAYGRDPPSTSASFTSQLSDTPVPSTVGSPVTRPRQQQRDRALDVSTILNPPPRSRVAPYDACRRPSLVHNFNKTSPTLRSRPPSPVEVGTGTGTSGGGGGGGCASSGGGILGMRPTPSVPMHSPGPIRSHPTRHRLSGIMSAQDNPFPLATSQGGPPTYRTPPPTLEPLQPAHQPPAPEEPRLTYAPGYSLGTPHSSANISPRSGYSYAGTVTSSPVSTTPTFSQAPFQQPLPQSLEGSIQQQQQQQQQQHQHQHQHQQPHDTPHQGMSHHALGVNHGGGPVMAALHMTEGVIKVPVDTTSASHLEAERRRRNAEASWRFRKRKKGRDQETSQRVTELEGQLREVESARDYFRSIVLHALQNGGRLPPLPPGIFQSDQQEEPMGAERTRGSSGDRVGAPGGIPPALGNQGNSGVGLPPQSPRTGNFRALEMPQHQHLPLLLQHHPEERKPSLSRRSSRVHDGSVSGRGREN